MEEQKREKLKKLFPDYFERFELPEGAREEVMTVYRACRSGKCDALSFMPSFEEHGYRYGKNDDPSDPGTYSLSTYRKPKDVKRFAAMDSDMGIPFTIAIGETLPKYGLVQPTRERNRKSRSSHVDWWLYKNAEPYRSFSMIEDFEAYYNDYKMRNEKNG